MQDTEIINLWRAYDRKLDESLALNRKNAEDITRIKVQSFLASMTPLKVFTILIGILWVGFVDMIIINLFDIAGPFFLVSAAIQVILTKLAIGIYLYQLIIIHQVNINDSILVTQEKIARLKSSTLWVARILFLQLPLWTTFFLNKSMFQHGSILSCFLMVSMPLLFTYAAIWLFTHIRYENRHQKWFRLIFNGKEWEPVMKSIDLLGQIDEYKN